MSEVVKITGMMEVGVFFWGCYLTLTTHFNIIAEQVQAVPHHPTNTIQGFFEEHDKELKSLIMDSSPIEHSWDVRELSVEQRPHPHPASTHVPQDTLRGPRRVVLTGQSFISSHLTFIMCKEVNAYNDAY